MSKVMHHKKAGYHRNLKPAELRSIFAGLQQRQYAKDAKNQWYERLTSLIRAMFSNRIPMRRNNANV